MTFKPGMTVDLCKGYLLMLISMILTLMHGHIGSASENKIWAMDFKLRMTVDFSISMTLTLTLETFVRFVLVEVLSAESCF